MRKFSMIKDGYFIFLLIFLMIRSVNAYSLLPAKIDSSIFSVLAIFGAMIVLQELIDKLSSKDFVNLELLLYLFLLVFFISTIVNREYGVTSNIKLLVWNSIYLIGLYPHVKNLKNKSSFINRIDFIIIISTFLTSLVSFVMFLTKYSYVHVYGPGARDHIRIGFLESRLFGVFGDPNYGATTTLVAMILCIFYLFGGFKKNKLPINIFLGVNIILNFFIIILSGSRSALLLSYVALALAIFYISIQSKALNKKERLMKFFFSIFVTLAVCLSYFFVETNTKKGLESLPNMTSSLFHGKSGKQNQVTLTRKDVNENKDISNMRFDIWKSGIEIFETTPLVGTSPRNLIAYSKDNLPNTFISERAIVVHNTFVNVLVSTGISGFTFFIIFILISGVSNLQFSFKKNSSKFKRYNVYFLIAIILLLSGFFNNEIILVNTIGTFIFWSYLGFINGIRKDNSFEKQTKNVA